MDTPAAGPQIRDTRVSRDRSTADAGGPDQVLRVRRRLDDLATAVARATDADDRVTAWRIVRGVEAALELADPGTALPASPVLARRFAAAHRRLLQRAACSPGVPLAALPDPGSGVPGR